MIEHVTKYGQQWKRADEKKHPPEIFLSLYPLLSLYPTLDSPERSSVEEPSPARSNP